MPCSVFYKFIKHQRLIVFRILRPPSPQPINKQIETFARYVELISRFKIFSLKHFFSRDSNDPVCMDWINLLIDLRRVTTFVGLGMSDFVIHDCQNFADRFIKIGRFSQEGKYLQFNTLI